MAVTKEAIAIVLDIGKPMHNAKDNPTVLEQAKHCINMIIQRKIFSESKDELALILFGTTETLNNLAEDPDSNYGNIKIVQEFQPASWELLEYVNNIQGTDLSTDFIDALVVAMDILYYKIKDAAFTGRILFISNFGSRFSTNQLNKICNAIKSKKMELNIIGPVAYLPEGEDTKDGTTVQTHDAKDGTTVQTLDTKDGTTVQTHTKDGTTVQTHDTKDGTTVQTHDTKDGTTVQTHEGERQISKAEKYVCHILKEVNGESYSFSEALPALIYYQKKKVQAMPWNANLDIGTNLTIPISAYIKIAECKPKSWKSAYAHKLTAKIERDVTYLMNDENQTKVPKEGIIPAFKYGTTLVPYSVEDKTNMDYQSGDKGMKVLGFTKAESVQRFHYTGDKVMYLFGQKNRELSGVILAPFIQALHDTEMVAIVRYVYSPRSAPKIGFLSPKIKPDYECLVFIVLPFMEDLRHFIFTPLNSDPKNAPSEEQLSAVDDLITAMDLTSPVDKDDEAELLKPKYTVNPYLQRLYQCLQHKAFHPEKPLPEILPHIKAILSPSEKLIDRAEPALKKIKSVFTFKESIPKKIPEAGNFLFPNGKSEVEVSVDKEKNHENPENEAKFNVLDAVTDKITQVGSVNPVRDFQYLISNMIYTFSDTCQQMMDVVFKFLQDSGNLKLYHSKILSICKELRRASLKEGDSSKYNSFMANLQNALLECDEELWDKIKSEKIGLITKTEVPSSLISPDEAESFLSMSCTQDNKETVKLEGVCDVDEDYDNLLDQL